MSTQSLSDRRAGLDVVATNLSIGIKPAQDLIGNALLPSIMRPTSTTTIGVWGTEAFRVTEDLVGDFSEPEKIDIAIDKVTFEINGHAIMAPISDRHQLESERSPLGVNLELEVLQTARLKMDLNRERAQAALVTAAGTYSTGNKVDLNTDGMTPSGGTTAGNHQWDVSTNDPTDDILPVVEGVLPDASGYRPNFFWMGQQVFLNLIQNQKIKDRVFGTTGAQGTPTTAQLENLFGGVRILVGRAITRAFDSTNMVGAGTITKVWGKKAGLVYVPPTSGSRIPAFGYTVEQSVFGGGSTAVFRIRDEKMGAAGGQILKLSSFYTPVILFKDAGFLFDNAIA